MLETRTVAPLGISDPQFTQNCQSLWAISCYFHIFSLVDFTQHIGLQKLVGFISEGVFASKFLRHMPANDWSEQKKLDKGRKWYDRSPLPPSAVWLGSEMDVRQLSNPPCIKVILTHLNPRPLIMPLCRSIMISLIENRVSSISLYSAAVLQRKYAKFS